MLTSESWLGEGSYILKQKNVTRLYKYFVFIIGQHTKA